MGSDEHDQRVYLIELDPLDRNPRMRLIERALWGARTTIWRVGLVVGVLLLLVLVLIPAYLGQGTSSSPSLKADAIPCYSSSGGATNTQALVGLAVNSQGFVYEADMGRDRVKGFDSRGQSRFSWGCLGRAQGQFDFGLNEGEGIAVDREGDVYVDDSDNARIQRFDRWGHFLLSWGVPSSQPNFYPVAVSVDRQGDVYVVDFVDARIEKFDGTGHLLLAWGSHGSGNGQFFLPDGIAVDGGGDVYVADRENARIEKFDSTGHFLLSWGSHGRGDGQFAAPVGIAIDGQDHIYVADRDNGRVEMFDSAGHFLRRLNHLRSKDGQSVAPISIAVGGNGTIYIVAQHTDCIQKLNPSGDTVVEWTC
jgi:tripartite motif-containing protein 71